MMATNLPLTFAIERTGAAPREQRLLVSVPGAVKIGTLDSSQLRLDDDQVARMHAVIEVNGPDDLQLMDLGSGSGTLLRGVRVTKVKLEEGVEFTLGSTRLRLRVGAPQPVAVERPAAAAPAPTGLPLSPGLRLPQGYAAASATLGAGAALPAGTARVEGGAWGAGSGGSEQSDAARAVEITTMFEETVLSVRHLDNPAGGHATASTYAVITGGALLVLAALAVAVAGYGGLGALLLPLGVAVGLYGAIRLEDDRRSPDFTLGSVPGADVNLVDAAVPAERFPLVRADGRDYALLFTAQMGGDVTIGGERLELNRLAGGAKVRPVPEFGATFAYPIPPQARIKVDIGATTFLINSVQPARRLASPFGQQLDWLPTFGVSAAAHLLLLFLVFAVPPDAKALSLDLFDADNELVKYLIKAPERKDEDLPEWLKAKKGPQDAGGKGQRHKGDEGKMGSKTSKNRRGLYGLKGPKDNPDPHLARELAEHQAKTAGVLGLLGSPSGSHLASIFGRDTALGTDAEDVMGGLIGDQIGEAYGAGGLGLVGTGRGGGGTGEGTIGLGALGTIGKGGGGGDGAGYGTAAGRLAGRTASVPIVQAGQAEVRGALDKEIIRRVIRAHINEVKFCYSQALQTDEDLGGRVVIEFTIAANGTVVASRVQTSTLGNARVDQCIADAVRRWPFPKPKGGGIVIVSYPFVLQAAGG
ncbi:MAG: TonB family protein [Proteobacteria bacterium]|nr:TonB family protein [Pseudomonadota bacterium]